MGAEPVVVDYSIIKYLIDYYKILFNNLNSILLFNL